MIFGVGTDIIEVERIAKELARDTGLMEKLFTGNEIRYCTSKRHPEQHFAARFAAKEAFFKALGTGWRYGMQYAEVELENDELGNPQLNLSGKTLEWANEKKITKYHVSVSHIKAYALAFVTLEQIH